MPHGLMYLMAVNDLKSRYVLIWSVSNIMDDRLCANVFIETVQLHRAPKIFSTDQGRESQFTSHFFYRGRQSKRPNRNSPWMAMGERSTTFSSNGYGGASKTSTFT
ncbi:MAG: transposase family protein [Desulfobulbaceae bacterium]|nr:transposase family protein [Desulfobulbaceae bacterium]